MINRDFKTTLLLNATPHEVYEAVNRTNDWWQGDIVGNTDALQSLFRYTMGDVHYSEQKIVALVPDQKVMWQITNSQLSFTKIKNEWTGTSICFEISKEGNQTKLVFTHVGLSPKLECYEACSNAWEQLIQKSLKSLITTGKGVDVF